MEFNALALNRDHYWLKKDAIVDTITFEGRTFFNKYEKVNRPLSDERINDHLAGKITIAHSLIFADDSVRNIVCDYNGKEPQRFYHWAKSVLKSLGFENFTAFETKTAGHLHLYIHCGRISLQEATQLGTMISQKLAEKIPKQWRFFPNDRLPRQYNILNIPYALYAQEVVDPQTR
jgi:hypothetical protein